MAERVVDVLEPVQVEEQHRDAVVLAACTHDRAREPLREQGAVGQVGQRVVVGEVAQFLLGAFLVGDVAQHCHVQRVLAVAVEHGAALVGAEELLAVLALLPHFAGPAAMTEDYIPQV